MVASGQAVAGKWSMMRSELEQELNEHQVVINVTAPLEQELNEHQVVINVTAPLEQGWKCFRVSGGALVERTGGRYCALKACEN